MLYIEFSDKLVSYETFMRDLAARVARILKSEASDPTYISQRRAYAVFGRSNIERWKRAGKIKPICRPGKIEYLTADLRLLQQFPQDYLIK